MVSLIILGVFLCILVAAFWVGGRVERIGAGIFLTNVVLGLAFEQADLPIHATWMLDGATACAFGALALRNPERLWPGVAGVATTFVMVFSATRALGFPMSEFAYSMSQNLSGLLVQASLAAGVWSHRWGPKSSDPLLQPA